MVALLIGAGLTVGVMGASATGNPPWEPIANPPEAGSLTFYNAAGQQITGGSTTTQPFAAYIQGSTELHAGDVKATVLGYTPVNGQAPGAWSGEAISASTTYPNASAPGSLGTSSLPLVTGAAGDESIAQYVSDFPNSDTSGDGYAGLYVLRVKTSGTSAGVSTSYDSADIQVSGSTWTVVYPTPTLTSTTTSLSALPASPQVSGTSVTLTATVSPSAPGTVQFEYGTGTPTDIGSPVTVTGGTASISTAALPAGADNLSAVFTPAQFSAYSGSTGTASYTINSTLTPTNTTLTATPSSPQNYGTSVTLNASVTTSGVAGSVQFEYGSGTPTLLGSPVTVVAGAASTTTTALPVGTNDLGAVFSPSTAGYAPSTGTNTFTIDGIPTITTLTASPTSPQFAGTSVTLNATVTTSGVDGSVQFEYGSGTPTLLGSPVALTAGTASTSTTALPVGADDLSAVFTPTTPGYAASTGTDSFTIDALTATDTTLTASPSSPQNYGTSVTLNATVTTSGVDGSIQFEYGSGTPTLLGSPVALTAGTASTSTTALPVGTDDLSAVFTPTTAGYSGSTGTATFEIDATPTTTTLTASPTSPQFVGTSLTLNASVSPAASGTVQFEYGSGTPTLLGGPVAVSAGTASTSTTALPVGTDDLSAVFTPGSGSNDAGSTGTDSFTINALTPTATTLAASPGSPQIYGTSVTLNATVTTSGVGGTVQFEYGSSTPALLGSPVTVSAGAASISTTALPVGTDDLSAVFTPTTAGYAASTGTTSYTITGIQTATSASVSPTSTDFGQSVNYSATVTAGSGTPTGSVTFATGASNLCTATLAAGTGSCNSQAAPVGTDTVTASYSGDSEFATSTGTTSITVAPSQQSPSPSGSRSGNGYWLVASDGGIFSGGNAGYFGSGGALRLNAPVVGLASTPDSHGYWLVASDGGVLTYGDAGFFGSAGGLRLKQPIVGIATTPDGGGYWLVASDGGVFSYGDAHFYGSAGALALQKPIVGIATTPDGGGYWLVASDGGIFSYGDAHFYGSAGALKLNKPIVGIATTPDGGGYWLAASDGGIFTYGDARFHGSAGALNLVKPIVGIAATPDGGGYWLVASDGGIFTGGDAAFHGSAAGLHLAKPIVGLAGS
jgi:tryptophanyl-tRNA synthetase